MAQPNAKKARASRPNNACDVDLVDLQAQVEQMVAQMTLYSDRLLTLHNHGCRMGDDHNRRRQQHLGETTVARGRRVALLLEQYSDLLARRTSWLRLLARMIHAANTVEQPVQPGAAGGDQRSPAPGERPVLLRSAGHPVYETT